MVNPRAVHSAILSEAAHEQNLPFNPEKKGLWAETGKKELLIKKGRLESNFPAFRAWSSTTRAFKNVTAPFSSTRPMGTAQKVVNFDQLTICYFAHRRCPPPQVTEFAMASRR